MDPPQAAVDPKRAPRDTSRPRACPRAATVGLHAKASKPTCRAAESKLRGARTQRRTHIGYRNSAVAPDVRCEADTTTVAPRCIGGWNNGGLELRRALANIALPKDKGNTTSTDTADVDRAADVATGRDPVTFRERSQTRKHLDGVQVRRLFVARETSRHRTECATGADPRSKHALIADRVPEYRVFPATETHAPNRSQHVHPSSDSGRQSCSSHSPTGFARPRAAPGCLRKGGSMSMSRYP